MNVNLTLPLLAAMLCLAACGGEPPQVPDSLPQPAMRPPAELVDELARDPARLNEVRRLCREDRDAVSEELCIASAMAARQRFMGEGKTRYTPEPVELPEAEWPQEPARD